ALRLRKVGGASESRSFAYSEGLAGRTQDILDIREAFGRVDQSDWHNLRIVCLCIDNMCFRIVAGAGPVCAATGSSQCQRGKRTTDLTKHRRIKHRSHFYAFDNL